MCGLTHTYPDPYIPRQTPLIFAFNVSLKVVSFDIFKTTNMFRSVNATKVIKWSAQSGRKPNAVVLVQVEISAICFIILHVSLTIDCTSVASWNSETHPMQRGNTIYQWVPIFVWITFSFATLQATRLHRDWHWILYAFVESFMGMKPRERKTKWEDKNSWLIPY